MLEAVKQLIPGSGDPSSPRPQAGGNSPSSQASFEELDDLVKMAKVLQEVAVSELAEGLLKISAVRTHFTYDTAMLTKQRTHMWTFVVSTVSSTLFASSALFEPAAELLVATLVLCVQVEKAEDSEIQRKELSLPPESMQAVYYTTLRGGLWSSYLAASVIASDMVATSKIGAMGRVGSHQTCSMSRSSTFMRPCRGWITNKSYSWRAQ